MRFMIVQGHGQRIVWFQGDGGGVSDADRADAAGGAPGGGVRVAHGDGQHSIAALGVRRARGAVRGGRDERREPRPVRGSADARSGADGGVHGEEHPEGFTQLRPAEFADRARRDCAEALQCHEHGAEDRPAGDGPNRLVAECSACGRGLQTAEQGLRIGQGHVHSPEPFRFSEYPDVLTRLVTHGQGSSDNWPLDTVWQHSAHCE